MYAVELATPCRQGRLIITRETVRLERRQALGRHPRWTAARADIVGASIAREPGTVYLLICEGDGTTHRVDPLVSSDALRIIELLGYAAGVSSVLSGGANTQQKVRMPCAGGRAELDGGWLIYRPRLPWRRSTTWTLSLDQILGVSSVTRPGTRMLHDLAIHTSDGRAHVLRRLRPEHALTLSRLCGHLYAALPAEPKSQREALDYHITSTPRTLPANLPAPVAVEPPAQPTRKRRPKHRGVQRDLDDLWTQQRSATDRFRPLAGA